MVDCGIVLGKQRVAQKRESSQVLARQTSFRLIPGFSKRIQKASTVFLRSYIGFQTHNLDRSPKVFLLVPFISVGAQWSGAPRFGIALQVLLDSNVKRSLRFPTYWLLQAWQKIK